MSRAGSCTHADLARASLSTHGGKAEYRGLQADPATGLVNIANVECFGTTISPCAAVGVKRLSIHWGDRLRPFLVRLKETFGTAPYPMLVACPFILRPDRVGSIQATAPRCRRGKPWRNSQARGPPGRIPPNRRAGRRSIQPDCSRRWGDSAGWCGATAQAPSG